MTDTRQQILADHVTNINRAISHIEERIDSTVSLSELAKVARMSLWHFQRIFHALVGEPVKTFLRRRKLTHVSELLLSSRAPLDGLASIAGFGSVEAFSRAFQRQFGAPPGTFRKADKRASVSAARAPLGIDYLLTMFNQLSPPEVTIQTVPSTHLIGVLGQFYSCFSDQYNGPEVTPILWRRLAALIGDHRINGVGDSWGVISRQLTDPDSWDLFDYFASFEVHERQLDQLRWLEADLVPLVFSGGMYATFYHQNPPHLISHNLNYVFCIWLSENHLILDDRPEFERYAAGYLAHDLSHKFFYGIPVRTA